MEYAQDLKTKKVLLMSIRQILGKFFQKIKNLFKTKEIVWEDKKSRVIFSFLSYNAINYSKYIVFTFFETYSTLHFPPVEY